MLGSETLLSTKSFSGHTIGAVLVLGVLVAGGQALAQPDGDAEAGSPPAADAGPVVAVMPFVNVSGRPEDDWMGDGIAETLISGVQSSSGLPVVDRSAGGPAAGARGQETPTRPDAPEPGVSWLVEGGFQRVDERLRIVARVTTRDRGGPGDRQDRRPHGRAFACRSIVTGGGGTAAGRTEGAARPPAGRRRRGIGGRETERERASGRRRVRSLILGRVRGGRARPRRARAGPRGDGRAPRDRAARAGGGACGGGPPGLSRPAPGPERRRASPGG